MSFICFILLKVGRKEKTNFLLRKLEFETYCNQLIFCFFMINLIIEKIKRNLNLISQYRRNKDRIEKKRIDYWAVWGRKLSSTVLREGTAYSDRGEQAILQGDSEIAEAWSDQAAEYWKQAIALTPGNYIEAHNWLKITKRFEFE